MKVYYKISPMHRNLMLISSISLGVFSINSLLTISKMKVEPGLTKTEMFLASALVLPAAMSYSALRRIHFIGRKGPHVIIKSFNTRIYKKQELSLVGNELKVGNQKYLLDPKGFDSKNEFLKFLIK